MVYERWKQAIYVEGFALKIRKFTKIKKLPLDGLIKLNPEQRKTKIPKSKENSRNFKVQVSPPIERKPQYSPPVHSRVPDSLLYT